MINNLRKCAEYIRDKWGDNLGHGKNISNNTIDMSDNLWIKTIRR